MGFTNIQKREEREFIATADIGGGARLQAPQLNRVQSFRAEHVEVRFAWTAGVPGTRRIQVKVSGRTILANGRTGKSLAAKTWGGPWKVEDLDDELFAIPNDIETLVRALAPAGWEEAA